MRPILAIACLVFTSSAAATVFSTMTGVSVPPSGARKYGEAMMKPEELKSCLVDAYSIDSSDALFEMMRPKLEEERAELQRLREAAQGAPTTEKANAENELRAKARVFNTKVAALNGEVAYAQAARDRFSKTCKGRSYYLDDLPAVRDQLPVEVRRATGGK